MSVLEQVLAYRSRLQKADITAENAGVIPAVALTPGQMDELFSDPWINTLSGGMARTVFDLRLLFGLPIMVVTK